MNPVCRTVSHARKRLECQDMTLKTINLGSGSKNRKTLTISSRYTDTSLALLLDALIANPNIIKYLYLNDNYLTDVSGFKIAKFMALSNSIRVVNISRNQMGIETYVAIFHALHINTSLQFFNMKKNLPQRVDSLLFDLVHISPHNYSRFQLDFTDYHSKYHHDKFVHTAEKTQPPSMLKMLLHIHTLQKIFTPRKH